MRDQVRRDATPSCVFDSGNGGWLIVGGTSLASPVTAAICALTGQGGSNAQYTYVNSGASFDVTSGSNGLCGGSYPCTAGAGYDGPTGNGTPRASVLAAQAHIALDSPAVFDANFYLATNSDLHAAFGNDLAAARNHWLNTGVDEGRIAAPTFSSKSYISHYSDLQNAFGGNYRAAMTHFLGQGLPVEGRRAWREFDVAFYLAHYSDLQAASHTDFAAALNHFVFQGRPSKAARDRPTSTSGSTWRPTPTCRRRSVPTTPLHSTTGSASAWPKAATACRNPRFRSKISGLRIWRATLGAAAVLTA